MSLWSKEHKEKTDAKQRVVIIAFMSYVFTLDVSREATAEEIKDMAWEHIKGLTVIAYDNEGEIKAVEALK